jgi:ABC-type transport system substrate-binding protein
MKAVVSALALAAVAVMPVAQAETPASTLVMAMNIDDIISLDPAETFELVGGEVNANVYDRITVYEPGETTLSGGVAESWDIADDGHTIILHVRPGQTFHSGNPVAAADVVFSLSRPEAPRAREGEEAREEGAYMPSLTPLTAGTRDLTPLAVATEALVALVEAFPAAAYVIPGTLPASDLYPGADTLPRDNVDVAAIPGPVLTPLTEV